MLVYIDEMIQIKIKNRLFGNELRTSVKINMEQKNKKKTPENKVKLVSDAVLNGDEGN